MSKLIEVLIIDSVVSNTAEVRVEEEALAGFANVRSLQVKNETELPDWIEEIDAIIIWHQVKVSSHTLGRLKKCRLIVRNGVGFDNVDVKTAGELGIPVCNVPDYGTEEVADHTMALALALSRNLFPYIQQTKNRGWDWKIGQEKLRRFRGRNFGIIGLGRIGTAVALRAKAFQFEVVFFDPYLSAGVEKALGIRRAWRLEDLLDQADIVSLHCPLTGETTGMIGQEQFAKMKDGVFLVNTARGGIINLNDLKDALKSGRVAGAGLDVADAEPPNDWELLRMPTVIATPHAAFYSRESFRECRYSASLLVRRYFEDGTLMNQVNSEFNLRENKKL
jgi:phosphoglycerate dehydrogenase-like enzyme